MTDCKQIVYDDWGNAYCMESESEGLLNECEPDMCLIQAGRE